MGDPGLQLLSKLYMRACLLETVLLCCFFFCSLTCHPSVVIHRCCLREWNNLESSGHLLQDFTNLLRLALICERTNMQHMSV